MLKTSMLKTSIFGGIVGGIILFVWSALSWMALPWHMATLHSFKDEAAVAQVLQVNAPESGMYVSQSPMIFAAVANKNMPASMAPAMIIEFVTQIICAFLLTWMLTKTNLSYLGRLGFVIVFAFAAGLMTDMAYWNWFHFDTKYTLVMFADLVIGWFLAGLVLAKLTAHSAK